MTETRRMMRRMMVRVNRIRVERVDEMIESLFNLCELVKGTLL